MNPPEEPTPPKPIHSGWFLAAPWIGAVLILAALLSGALHWFSQTMPLGLGRHAQQNALSGLILLIIGSSALWARRRARTKGKREGERIGYIVWTTIWLTFAQVVTMGGVFFVGCSIVLSNML